MHAIRLNQGRTRATVLPAAGGRLHQLEIHDGERWLQLLLAPDRPERHLAEPLLWGAYAMVPWPGRVNRGVFSWRGVRYALSAAADGHALHGRGVYSEWRVDAESANACRLSLDLGEGWPFGGRAVQEFELLDDGVRWQLELHATGVAFPAGAGWHPWFRRDVRPDVDVRVTAAATEICALDGMIPTGELVPVSGESDLRGGPALADRRLDTCYRNVKTPMVIRWGDVSLAMMSSPNVGHAVVHTPERGVCLEPQTCAPDAFNLASRGADGAGVIEVAPDRPLVAETVWRWSIARS